MRRQLALVLIVAALLVKFWPFNLPAPPGFERNSLSIRGLRLGMTRAEVVQKIGPPLQEAESQNFKHFTEARYQKNSWEQDPQVTYSSSGRVLAVVGRSLEWSGGSIAYDFSEKNVLRLFPEAVELSRASYHPGGPGRYFCASRNLTLYTEAIGFFSPNRFDRAQLAVPYLASLYCNPAEFRNPLIFATASKIELSNRSRLLKAKTIGCFQCCKVLSSHPQWTTKYPSYEEPSGICPYCGHATLLGENTGELTPAYLRAVHDAWLEPL